MRCRYADYQGLVVSRLASQANSRMTLRTCVTFLSARFNQTTPREYFINPGCFGDDCAAWLAALLRDSGASSVAEPWQEDWGWQARRRWQASGF
jgi:hypothetical protein